MFINSFSCFINYPPIKKSQNELLTPPNAQDEERAVCDCLNPFDVIVVELARHLFFGALVILGDVPEVRGDIVEMTCFEKLI
jgi:hypothetical protein